jgi:hypothetical protein
LLNILVQLLLFLSLPIFLLLLYNVLPKPCRRHGQDPISTKYGYRRYARNA